MSNNSQEIVISGISGRFPKCENIEDLSIKLFSNDDLICENIRWADKIKSIPSRMGTIDNLNKFDNEYFGIKNLADDMDPSSRILLELATEALVDSGTLPESMAQTRTAVLVGLSDSEAYAALFQENQPSSFRGIGTLVSCMATRISHALDLRGPSFTVSSACSSSGTAIYQAFNMIKMDLIDSAIVGATQLCLSPTYTQSLNSLGALSKDGKCKFMDKTADGYVRSESCCVIFLQRLSSAKRVYAKILNIESNNDGKVKRSFLSTSDRAQVELFELNLRKCNLQPKDVVYVEAHGTGTAIGDDIEIRALAEAYGKGRDRPLLVGSVKTNLGHTEATSGLCSIAKAILIFEKGLIPASLHYNDHKNSFDDIIPNIIVPVVKNTEYSGGVIAVNVFGMGGTNVQLLLGITEFDNQFKRV